MPEFSNGNGISEILVSTEKDEEILGGIEKASQYYHKRMPVRCIYPISA